jgi:hypothetical protein
MTGFVLLSGVTATQNIPAAGVLPPGSQIADLSRAGAMAPNQIPANQTFHVIVAGAGSVSATVQLMVSNDSANWLSYGSPIVVSSGGAPQQGSAAGATPWAYYTAYVTAISGTATVSCRMNA